MLLGEVYLEPGFKNQELSRTQPVRLLKASLVEDYAEISSKNPSNQALSGVPLTGQTIGGRYRLDDVLGSGGMSIVYRGLDLQLQRVIAVKVMHAHLNFQQKYLQRFQQEGKALSKLDHENIVRVYEYGLHGESIPYMVMEYVNGTNLATKLERENKLSINCALDVALQVSHALEHAHKSRVIHRDLKPSNIMIKLDESGNELVKIVDFGIAKIASETHSQLTGTGEVFGSPIYMSPEQCGGTSVDSRTDLYSLGCIIYECLVGIPPIVGDSALATMMKHQHEDPTSLHQATMGEIFPDELERIVGRLLSKAPEKRYACVPAQVTKFIC